MKRLVRMKFIYTMILLVIGCMYTFAGGAEEAALVNQREVVGTVTDDQGEPLSLCHMAIRRDVNIFVL